jgi:nucleotide-binding universal stress UspA family protein
MRILCGSDFSPSAVEAATVAAHWSSRTGGELLLLHVCRPARGADSREQRERLIQEGKRLQDLGARVSRLDVMIGEIDETILQEAGHRRADLIVLGPLGERVKEHWLTGSIATRVARDSPVPVLVVRRGARLESWLRGERGLKLLTGFERGESTDAALRWAAETARLGHCELTVIQLVMPGPENRRAHSVGPGMGLNLQPDTERQLLDQLKTHVAQEVGDVPVRLLVKPALGRIDRHLAMEAEDLDVDLVVVGSHQRHGFQRWWSGSVSHGLLNAAGVSVVVVPSKAATA